jgi:hypothetical protein
LAGSPVLGSKDAKAAACAAANKVTKCAK